MSDLRIFGCLLSTLGASIGCLIIALFLAPGLEERFGAFAGSPSESATAYLLIALGIAMGTGVCFHFALSLPKIKQ